MSLVVHVPNKTLLRFIARLHCTWWLPYRSLVRRLQEVEAINPDQFSELYSVEERDLNGEYARMALAINKEDFTKLNAKTKNKSTSPASIEIIIRNFEDDLITEDSFTRALGLFGKSPVDFGYDYAILEEDLDELEDLFGGR